MGDDPTPRASLEPVTLPLSPSLKQSTWKSRRSRIIHIIPKTLAIPYTRPTIDNSVNRPQRAISEVDHPVVFCAFTVTIKTFASSITPTVKLIMPLIKLILRKTGPLLYIGFPI